METSARPGVEAAHFEADGLEGFEIDGKYRVGVCLSEGHRQRVYETFRGEQPANLRLIEPETADNASDLLAGFGASQTLRHSHLLEVYDYGEVQVNGSPCLYVITERADENLGDVLRHRALDETEARQILDGVIPALEFLHDRGFVHGRVKPSEVLACGETVKLNGESIRPVSAQSRSGDSSGLYAAPETIDGQFGPAADAWSLAVLILESLTGSPYVSEIGRLGKPFREIVEGGLRRDPELRWTVRQMGLALAGSREQKPAPEPAPEPVAKPVPRPAPVEVKPRVPEFVPPPIEQAKYRRFAGLALGGLLAAAAVCVLLIRSAHQAPSPAPVTIQAPPPAAAPAVAAPAIAASKPGIAAVPAGWAVVGAAYRRPQDAEKRQVEMQKAHPKLSAHVYAAGGRYLVIFGAGFSNEAEAKRQLAGARRAGAPRDSYLTRFR